MKNCKYKYQNKNCYKEKREKRKRFQYTGRSYRITVLQVLIISRIEDGVRYKFSCLKILISV